MLQKQQIMFGYLPEIFSRLVDFNIEIKYKQEITNGYFLFIR